MAPTTFKPIVLFHFLRFVHHESGQIRAWITLWIRNDNCFIQINCNEQLINLKNYNN